MKKSDRHLRISPTELDAWSSEREERARIATRAKALLGRLGTKIDFDRLDEAAFAQVRLLLENPNRAIAGRGFLEWHAMQRQPLGLRRAFS